MMMIRYVYAITSVLTFIREKCTVVTEIDTHLVKPGDDALLHQGRIDFSHSFVVCLICAPVVS